MISTDAMRKGAGYVAVCFAVLGLLHACGGGGGGSNESKSTAPQVVTQTPEPTATPTPIVVQGGGNIGDVARNAPRGAIVFVPAGSYDAFSLSDLGCDDNTGRCGVTIVGDIAGIFTASGQQGPVVIRGAGTQTGIEISDSTDVRLVGLTITGGRGVGLRISNSTGTVVRNCSIEDNTYGTGDGVRIETSADTLIFNNLVLRNTGVGVGVIGSDRIQIINNTIVKNQVGISIGDNAVPSGPVEVKNNIVFQNTDSGITVVAGSTVAGDHNLYAQNGTNYVGVDVGEHDLPTNTDPQFRYPLQGGAPDQAFYLNESNQDNPVVDAGDDPRNTSFQIDTGGQNLDLLDLLTSCGISNSTYGESGCGGFESDLTSQVDNSIDVPPVDLGYHYPIVLRPPTPTRKPKQTVVVNRTATPIPTKTRKP